MSVANYLSPTEGPRGPAEDPTATMRQARQEARQAAIRREQVIEMLTQLVLDTTFERSNALTRAVDDTLTQPPLDRWDLEQLRTHLRYRELVEVGRAWVRLCGEAWLTCVEAIEERRF
jgi:hypothetical protein